MWCFCVSGFRLDLARVAISSVHNGFEKHACGFEKKEGKCFQRHGFKGFVICWAIEDCPIEVFWHPEGMFEFVTLVWF